LLSSAETPRDFLAALGDVGGMGGMGHAVAVPPASTFLGEILQVEGSPAPESLETLVAVLQWHAAHQPERTHLIYLDEGETPAPMTYGQLWREARAVAAALQSRGIAPGESVALMLPTCPEFFPCFCGILLAGAVPVPIYPPARPQEIEDHLRRHAAILANAGARLLIADSRVALPARLLLGQVEGLAGVELAQTLVAASGAPVAVPVHADALALLQYTSGSTGQPKGVMLTHAQLLANIHAMAQAARVGRDDVFVSWLPLYHDMGLICAWLSSLAYALPFVVMSPLDFLARPGRWLNAISRYRGSLSGAPNFAYELCMKRIPEADLAGLDLSSWRIAFNGAEPVSADTMTRFATHFTACGLKPEALAPVYGLAECAVGLALTPGRGARIDTAPEWLGGLRVGRRFGARVDGELEGVWQGGYPIDAANTRRYGGHVLWHARAGIDLAPQWRATLRLMNLTDRRYAERVDFAFGEVRSFPGAGRSVFLGIESR